MSHLTVLQRTNLDGFPKAGLIEITGAHGLEASDRAILNLLYQYAHDSGRMSEKDAEWEIPLSRLRPSRHESNDRITACLDRLLKVIVNVPHVTADGEPRVLKTHLIDFVDLSADEASARATVRFGVPKKLQPVLAMSNRWGRIKAEVVCAMSSRYAMALYEMVQLRANLDRCIEPFPIQRFRDLLGVPPEAYERGNDFMRFVVDPTMLEVNGLSDVGVQIEVKRRHARAPIESVTVAWWKKQGDEFRDVMRERDRSKVGRMARLKGVAEQVHALVEG